MPKPPRKHLEVIKASALQPELFALDKHGSPHTRRVFSFDKAERKKQANALRALRAVRFPQGIATAVPGKTLYDNVSPHRHSKKFSLIDFKNAFENVDQAALGQKVEAILRKHARGKAFQKARTTIDDYMQDGAFLPGVPGLPQGNMTSQDLFNWYMRDADIALGHALWQLRNTTRPVATRYLDDLTVSSPSEFELGPAFRRLIRETYAYNAPGMEVNHSKSKLHTLGPRPVTITGLTLYPDGRITPRAELLDQANSIFGEMAAKLAAHDVITEHDFAVVAGYNGVSNLAGESKRSGSRLVRDTGVRAITLLGELGKYVE